MIVLDASAAVDALLYRSPHSDLIHEHLREHVGDLHAPHLLDAEVGEVLRRHVLRGALHPGAARDALGVLGGLRITRYAHLLFLPRALTLGDNLTVYDALYVALAEGLEAPLLTRDAGIARSAGRLVEVVHIR